MSQVLSMPYLLFAHRGQVGVGDVDGHGGRHIASHHQQQGRRLQHLGGEINETTSGKLEERVDFQKTSSIPLVELPSSFLSLKQTEQVKTLGNQKSHGPPTRLMTKPRTKGIAKKSIKSCHHLDCFLALGARARPQRKPRLQMAAITWWSRYIWTNT